MSPRIVEIDYTNWRGERRRRLVAPHSIEFNKNQWHPVEQWLMTATDMEDGRIKQFAMKDIYGWEPQG